MKALRIILTIYAVLYVIFIILEAFFPGDGFDPYSTEFHLIMLLFILFVVGFFVSWRNGLYGGIIFLAWYLGMYLAETLTPPVGDDVGRISGLPLLILGILFIVFHFWKRKPKQVEGEPDE